MRLFIYSIILLIPFSIYSQIPNGEFENWSMVYIFDFRDYIEEPDNWVTNNSPCCLAVSKTSDSYSGDFALHVANIAFDRHGRAPGSAVSKFKSNYTGNIISAVVKCDSISGTGSGYIHISGYTGRIPSPIGSWETKFKIPQYNIIEIEVLPFINYDSIRIIIGAYSESELNGPPTGYASLKVDKLTEGTIITSVRHLDSNDELRVYPNPCNNLLIISSSNKALNEITIFDSNGKKVLSEKNITSLNTKIDVSHFQSGIYFVQSINYNENTEIKKLIIN